MLTKIHPMPALAGAYDLRPLEKLELGGAQAGQVGVVRIAAGTRSPAAGYRTSAKHEIALIIQGRVQVETATDARIVEAGSIVVSSPTEEHATIALEDTHIFYVLIDPPGA